MRAATEMTGARAARPLAMCGDDADAAAQADIMRRMTEMRQRGMTDEQILEQIATEELFGTGIDVPKETPQALPLAGGADWGMWSQSESGMYLELNVPPHTSAQQVAVGVQVGFLDVRLADEPLLSGRLAQSMLSDVEWALDVRASDGQRILCIDLQKRKRDAADAVAGEALFASLRINSVEQGEPGLVSGVYVEEKRITNPKREHEDGAYGTYDGSVPDQRGGLPGAGAGPGGVLPLL